ncbi:UNVERIFIED_CONTAM: Long-chain-alcohol oxidase FAO4A, partial [Sesamum latifolium]
MIRRMQEEQGHEKSACSSSSQMEALTALCDTLLPSLDVSSVDDDDSLIQFYQTSASMAATPHALSVFGERNTTPEDLLERRAVWLLSTRIGTFLLCGRKSLSGNFPYFQRFSRVSQEEREKILLSWSDS